MTTPETRNQDSKRWREAHREDYLAAARESKRQARLDPIKRAAANASSVKSILKRRQEDSLFKLQENTRSLILASFKRKGWSKTTKTHKLLGCTFEEFRVHLEAQFKPGMSWENHGKWHMDHIKPCATAKTPEEFEALQHYTNFQPLWAIENLSKGATYVYKV